MPISDHPLAASTVDRIAGELLAAFEHGTAIEPLTGRHPGLTVSDAYRIQRALVRGHGAAGRTVLGRKIGLTAPAIQAQLGVSDPDFGVLLDSHVAGSGATLSRSGLRMIAPRLEAEVAFVLERDLAGPGVTVEVVRDATRALIPVFELIDSRIRDWRITLADTVADNASCLGAVLGTPVDPAAVGPTAELIVSFGRDGETLERGEGTAVMGDPAAPVAWLANQLAEFGEVLPAGQPILSGSFTAAVDAVPGYYAASFGPALGGVEVMVTA